MPNFSAVKKLDSFKALAEEIGFSPFDDPNSLDIVPSLLETIFWAWGTRECYDYIVLLLESDSVGLNSSQHHQLSLVLTFFKKRFPELVAGS